MLRSKRSFKQNLPNGEMNVVSLMDILTTLLFFLLISASFANLAGLDSSGFLSSQSQAIRDSKPVFTLELILHGSKSATIWLGPVNELAGVIDKAALVKFLNSEFRGNETQGFTKTVDAKNFQDLMSRVQELLIPIKKSFPSELVAVLALTDGVTYQETVDATAALKTLDLKREGIMTTNAIGQKETTRILFPSVILSEWSEGV